MQAKSYSFTTINPPNSSFSVLYAITDSGEVIGYSLPLGSAYQETGFIYDNGTYTTLIPPGEYVRETAAINNRGEVVGTETNVTGQQYGFIYNKGAYTTINPPGANSSGVTGINDRGALIGTGSYPNFTSAGFLTTKAQVVLQRLALTADQRQQRSVTSGGDLNNSAMNSA